MFKLPMTHGSRGEPATCNSSRRSASSSQQKDGKIRAERHNILHTLGQRQLQLFKRVTRGRGNHLGQNRMHQAEWRILSSGW